MFSFGDLCVYGKMLIKWVLSKYTYLIAPNFELEEHGIFIEVISIRQRHSSLQIWVISQ